MRAQRPVTPIDVALPDQRLRPRDPAATDPRHDHVRRDGVVHLPHGPDAGSRWDARAWADRARAGELRRRAESAPSGPGRRCRSRAVWPSSTSRSRDRRARSSPRRAARRGFAGQVRWLDAQGKPIGVSSIKDDDFDVRGDVITVRDRTRVFPSHALALRIAPDVTGCGAGGPTVLPIATASSPPGRGELTCGRGVTAD